MVAEEQLALFAQAPRARRVLLVSYGGGHVTKIAPVVRELEAAGVRCLVLALTIGYKRAQQLGLQPIGYKDLIHLVDRDLAMEQGRRLLGGQGHPDVDDVESHCYLGVNYLEWVQELGPEMAARRYAEKGRHGFLPVRFFGRVMQALQPGAVVATSSPRSEQAAVEAAVSAGIPALTMVDLFAPPSDPFLARQIHADRITVVSEEVREDFLSRGIEAWRVVTSGSPDFDTLFDPAHTAAASALRGAFGWQGLRVVLWAGYREGEGPGIPAEYAGTALGVAVERRLRQWVACRPDVALVVRYHPSQYHEFPNLGAQERVYVSNPGTEPIAPLLHLADVVVNQVSTVGLEAALLRRRVLNLRFAPSVASADFDLSSLGPSEPVPSLDALTATIESPAGEGFRCKMSVPEGRAAPRVASLLLELLEQKTN